MGMSAPTIAALSLLAFGVSSSAFTPLPAIASRSKSNLCPANDKYCSSSDKPLVVVHNVPPRQDDTVATKDAADREAPPQSFYQLQQNSVKAAKLAIEDGEKLLEIEFPPLPAKVLEMDDVTAYDLAQANLKLALDFSKAFAAPDKNIVIMLPDEAERDIALENVGGKVEPYPNVRISSLRQSDIDDTRAFKPEQVLLSLFGSGSGGAVKAVPNTYMYVIIVASAQELPDVEELSQLDPNALICMYNLKLDTLRGDLGNPAFPGKDFHDRFLSTVKPVYYLRTRQYSRSTPNPPFMVNYQGCLFRSYPGQFQTFIDPGNGKPYRRVLGSDFRPPLGEFKNQLTKELQDQGILPEEGKTLTFFRTGYKQTTWWEEEREEASDGWRT